MAKVGYFIFDLPIQRVIKNQNNYNCLQAAGLVHIGDLVQLNEGQCLNLPDMNQEVLNSLKKELTSFEGASLKLNMSLPSIERKGQVYRGECHGCRKKDISEFGYFIFDLTVDLLDLPERGESALETAEISTIGDLVQKSVREMTDLPNFGRETLKRLKEELKELGDGQLKFGTELPKIQST